MAEGEKGEEKERLSPFQFPAPRLTFMAGILRFQVSIRKIESLIPEPELSLPQRKLTSICQWDSQ
jgi:hypothetical protein